MSSSPLLPLCCLVSFHFVSSAIPEVYWTDFDEGVAAAMGVFESILTVSSLREVIFTPDKYHRETGIGRLFSQVSSILVSSPPTTLTMTHATMKPKTVLPT